MGGDSFEIPLFYVSRERMYLDMLLSMFDFASTDSSFHLG